MVIIPALLIIWANYTRQIVCIPVPTNAIISYSGLLVGVFFIISGMLHLWIFGKGLPMNAFPPKYFVKKGVYAITRNPIYFGTAILSFSISSILNSSSGFWLISPLFTLMIIAYTIGFENERTLKIFGPQNYKPLLSLPENIDNSLTLKDRFSAYILSYLPWLLVYEAFIFIGVPKDALYSNFNFEHDIPIIESSTIFYVFTYLYALLIPVILHLKRELRNFEIDVWLVTGISAIIYFTIPFVVNQQSFSPHSLLGDLLLFDRSTDGISASFPAFHAIWALIATRYFTICFKKLKWLWYSVLILILLSCITTGNHSILDIIAGIFIFVISVYRNQIWDFIRMQSEHIANSWTEWRFGSVRIINHGFYAGAASFVGTLLVGSFLGSKYAVTGFITGIFGIVGGALWAQFIEGSPKLQRPYGYYGSVIGIIIGSALIMLLFQINFFILLASWSLAATWIQILGRLRCLIQGCCHGKPAGINLGIRFTHPYSRVNKISGLQGALLHPTQLYSIGTNLFTSIILFRLFQLNMPAAFTRRCGPQGRAG